MCSIHCQWPALLIAGLALKMAGLNQTISAYERNIEEPARNSACILFLAMVWKLRRIEKCSALKRVFSSTPGCVEESAIQRAVARDFHSWPVAVPPPPQHGLYEMKALSLLAMARGEGAAK